MNRTLLEIKNLKKAFDGVVSVNDASFSIEKESITLITGENGAGKTTLFNLITGLEKANDGTIVFNGEEITAAAPLQIARMGVVRMYQQPRLFKNLLVWENLLAAAHQNGSSNLLQLVFSPRKAKVDDAMQKQKARDLLKQFGLEELSNRIAGELSYGQQKLIAFCMIAMNGTKLALLDEPFAGLNPIMIDKLSKIILHMRGQGITFLVIEHNMNKALALCDNHIVMDEGKIVETHLKKVLA